MENVNFVLGAEVLPIDLIELDNSGDMPFWRWSTTGEPLVFTFHNCQMVFIIGQEPHDYFDFIVDFHYKEISPLSHDGGTPARYEKVPSLISEHMFLYAQDWKNDGV
jgi:hypothetical protein